MKKLTVGDYMSMPVNQWPESLSKTYKNFMTENGLISSADTVADIVQAWLTGGERELSCSEVRAIWRTS